jgi:hypothetical protein
MTRFFATVSITAFAVLLPATSGYGRSTRAAAFRVKRSSRWALQTATTTTTTTTTTNKDGVPVALPMALPVALPVAEVVAGGATSPLEGLLESDAGSDGFHAAVSDALAELYMYGGQPRLVTEDEELATRLGPSYRTPWED